MKTFLKIKIKSLADEAVSIKREEAKWKHAPWHQVDALTNAKVTHPMFFKLQEHRLHVVRTECRASTIAYGYMRGRAYREIENTCHEQPNWARVEQIIVKFSGGKYLATDMRKKLSKDLEAWASIEPEVYSEPEDLDAHPIYEAFEVAKEIAHKETMGLLERIGGFFFE